ncbi:hypothetical protein HMI56_004585 [Coelomomyces lativittatus]|nr:hypothetical protein HMI56_004585 [Coelomomyces lativittatus]
MPGCSNNSLTGIEIIEFSIRSTIFRSTLSLTIIGPDFCRYVSWTIVSSFYERVSLFYDWRFSNCLGIISCLLLEYESFMSSSVIVDGVSVHPSNDIIQSYHPRTS